MQNAVLERKSEVSRNQAMAKLLNEKLISAQEILMTSKKGWWKTAMKQILDYIRHIISFFFILLFLISIDD